MPRIKLGKVVLKMQENEIQCIIASQRQFFSTGKTLDINFRLESLKKLKAAIINHEQAIIDATGRDLRKPLMESYTSEIGMVINEINYALKNLRNWAKPQRVRSPLMVFPAKSYIFTEPYGNVLIISPWNYPIQLTMAPLVGAIGAGNCSIIKPSEFSKASEGVIKQIINEAFASNYIAVVDGDGEVSQYLLEQHFNKIFFTGSPRIGRMVMEKAARNLTPVTLELGGKSPCIVDRNINLDVAAKRILWGKFINAGQTCIAPDYLIVHQDIKEKLYAAMKKWLRSFYSENPQDSPDLARIINKAHFTRLQSYLQEGRIIVGGGSSETDLYIEPTIIEVADLHLPIMQEEIFGPILPVIEYSSLEDIEGIIAVNPDPLGCYLFSANKKTVNGLIQRIHFGGGCVNDTLNHAINHYLPFGGRGNSGLGAYHGIHSFEAFSHKKSVLKKGFALDMAMKYPPYKNGHEYIKKYLLK